MLIQGVIVSLVPRSSRPPSAFRDSARHRCSFVQPTERVILPYSLRKPPTGLWGSGNDRGMSFL